VVHAKRPGIEGRFADAIIDIVGAVPKSTQVASDVPHLRALQLAKRAARTAAGISGGAAMAPGPFGLLTLLPDIVGVWRVQAQMVADIAAAYGKSGTLTQEQMIYCLFKHVVSQGLRDIVVRAGERYLVRQASFQFMRKVAAAIGVQVSQRAMGKAVARYAPIVGAAGVAAYAYYDTKKIADSAIDLFRREVVLTAEDVATPR
jgi:hypothetical protein